jgi:hypothetical protein
MSKSLWTAIVAVAGVFVGGCTADKGYELAEVEGVVTINGQPAENMGVEFWPTGEFGPKSRGITDAQGRFVLSTWDGLEKGAVVGQHKVVVRDNSLMKVPFAGRANENVDTTQGAKPRMADVYTNFNSTPLEADIKGEDRDLAFNLNPYAGPTRGGGLGGRSR